MKRTLRRQVFPVYVGLVTLAVLTITLYSSYAFSSFFRKEKEHELTGTASMLAAMISPDTLTSGTGAEAFCGIAGDATGNRITLVRTDGSVAGDSEQEPSGMDNHAGRPEIRSALGGERGVSVRRSATLGVDMMYVTVPVVSAGKIIGVVRVAASISGIGLELRDLLRRSAASGLAAIVLTAVMSWLLVKRIGTPLELMRRAAERYARGELGFRFSVDRPDELRTLAETMNAMASRLAEQIRTITDQKNELDGILSNMTEAVLLLDGSLRIRTMNSAAGKLFGPAVEAGTGKTILQAFRNTDLQAFAERTLAAGAPVEENITVYGEKPLHLQAHGTALAPETGERAGVLLVLADISRLVRLEEIRKDFVANVSHELRTPVTSIRGFVETLREGAAKDPETAEKFLAIIARHAERLQAIIDDLLTLSRLEQGKRDAISFEDASIGDIVRESVELCLPSAEKKHISLDVSLPDEPFTARVSPLLLEQAVTNLLDNAVKYSDGGTSVGIAARSSGGHVEITVSDSGCGIPSKDLPRIFERFYRVDRARSRALGGTGLGLAIVKHIALAHGGEVSVRSEPGKGSVFTIRLPSG